jgi:NitT/TauT family transport system ATP-binding protein
LANISFAVAHNEFLCIVGPSGCGKTTLLKMIAGIVKPTSGEVIFGAGSSHIPRNALVFQEHGLFPWMTVLENVAFGLEMERVSRKVRQQAALEFIGKVGLEGFSSNYPHELSVGMRQRVALARAFLTDVEILLMDEPFGSLDVQTKLVLQQELLQLWNGDQRLVIYVTHDIEEAILLADRILVLTGLPGEICDEIPVDLKRPRDLSNNRIREVSELRNRIWKMLEQEVRKRLSLPQ